MSDIREKIINSIIEMEGGYSNDPSDSGGETMYGITKKVAIENGYTGDMVNMPEQLAFDIYVNKYWNPLKAHHLPTEIAKEAVDTAVNMGAPMASLYLQKALNLFTDAELVEDGIIGSKTLVAMDDYMNTRNDTKTLLKVLNTMQGARYIKLAEQRKKDRKFIYGWFKNRVSI